MTIIGDYKMKTKEEIGEKIEVLNDKTKVCDWYQDEIDVDDYTDESIADYISPYGGILDGSEGAVRNQLIAECIFETDEVSNDWYE